jgi:protein involved in temperature-dependent protein secretion
MRTASFRREPELAAAVRRTPLASVPGPGPSPGIHSLNGPSIVSISPVLRDNIWAPVQITWQSGAEAVGFVPCRYPGSERSGVPALALATRTEWIGQGDDYFVGRGQRVFVTDAAEYSLLDVRSVTFGTRLGD